MSVGRALKSLVSGGLLRPRSSGFSRSFSTNVGRRLHQDGLNKPVNALEVPRVAGIASMFRLPVATSTQGLDACFVGVPFDCGTSNRSGPRFGPRQIRTESVTVKHFNKDTGAMPYDSINVADIGDVEMRMFYTQYAAEDIREAYKKYIVNGCKTLTIGGDHTITYPILQAYKEKYGPVGLVLVDAHPDTSPQMVGCDIAHGTPFYRAVEEGLLDVDRVVSIGLRASGYALDEMKWGQDRGFKCVPAVDCWHKSLVPLMAQVRQVMGDGPVYLSFDIDALDPSFAPGTGSPEIGGLTTIQGLEIVRGCRGLNIVGCDLVEVSPCYDVEGTTAVTSANLLFEMLCVLPGVKYGDVPKGDFSF